MSKHKLEDHNGFIAALSAAHEAGSSIMIDGKYVPPATVERLVHPEASGDRHPAAKQIVFALACQGLRLNSIYRLLVAAYPENDFQPDIDGLLDWVCRCGTVGEPCRMPREAINDVDCVVEFETKGYPELAALHFDRGEYQVAGSRRNNQHLRERLQKPRWPKREPPFGDLWERLCRIFNRGNSSKIVR